MEEKSKAACLFLYYKIKFLLITPMLATTREGSIWDEHVIKKSQKEIEKANKVMGRITAAVLKNKGPQITESKEIFELQACIRALAQLIGKLPEHEMPTDVDSLVALSKEMIAAADEKIQACSKIWTVFLRDTDYWPLISTHMILGNLKENLKIVVNNPKTGAGGDDEDKPKKKQPLSTKVSIGEVMASDVSPIHSVMRPSQNVLPAGYYLATHAKTLVGDEGKPGLLERPLRANGPNGSQVCIAMSEVLPAGTTFGCMLRVRKESPLTEEKLNELFAYGRSNGLGQWRGSGNMGQFDFRLELVPDYVEPIDAIPPEAWDFEIDAK